MTEAYQAGVSPARVAAVVLHESNFRPSARSQVGACGLMQLMPDTADWVNSSLGGNLSSPLNLNDPDINLRLGSIYLGYLERRFPGQSVAVIASYNAGPECTLDWMTTGGDLQLDDIGYPETRAYVKAVLASERMYRELYPELREDPQ